MMIATVLEALMAQLLVRNLAEADVLTLKERAKARNRSLEAEVRDILQREAASARNHTDFWAETDAIRESLRGTDQTDSSELRLIGRRGEE